MLFGREVLYCKGWCFISRGVLYFNPASVVCKIRSPRKNNLMLKRVQKYTDKNFLLISPLIFLLYILLSENYSSDCYDLSSLIALVYVGFMSQFIRCRTFAERSKYLSQWEKHTWRQLYSKGKDCLKQNKFLQIVWQCKNNTEVQPWE